MVSNIILANPRGYCAGVERALKIVEIALKRYSAPLYVRHQIIHNEYVVKDLESKGVIFVESLEEIPKGSRVIFSAHGIPPEVKDHADSLNLISFDATCPLVTKVHLEARRFYEKGHKIVLIGHKGHQEVIGTMGNAPMHLVESVQDIRNLPFEKSDEIIYLTQTTLSVDDTKEIISELKRQFPNARAPPKDDICYATQNRQDAIKKLAQSAEMILVIGSKNSSNSNRLVDTALKCNRKSILIPDIKDFDPSLLSEVNSVGISSGASVPEILVQELIKKICNRFPQAKISSMPLMDEGMHFLLPPELRTQDE